MASFFRSIRIAVLAAACVLPLWGALAAQSNDVSSVHGTTHAGADWKAAIPGDWNGVLLLWSRGYRPDKGPAVYAPDDVADALLQKGYALLGSSYSSGGWALEEAVPDQMATLEAFSRQVRKPDHVVAWGMSMGGLVTTALVEQYPAKIDGGVALCSSIGGSVGMMNMALDGAFAFKTFVAQDTDVRVVHIDDDLANLRAVRDALADAQTTKQGRARIALAGVLGGIPSWSDPNVPMPGPADYDAQEEQIARALPMGVFLPRSDQEHRSGGLYSWNMGVDYRQLVDRSGRRDLLEYLYNEAGLDLDDDLERLNHAKRIQADRTAVEYMMRNYVPTAKLTKPLIALQQIGDGSTSPSLQQGYAAAIARDGDSNLFRSLWTKGAGHCTFAPDDLVSAVEVMIARVSNGNWPATLPETFIDYSVPPMMRTCFRNGTCDIPKN
jgi:pimeloyl-ACP methyl ester carboxylesterase